MVVQHTVVMPAFLFILVHKLCPCVPRDIDILIVGNGTKLAEYRGKCLIFIAQPNSGSC